MLLTGCASRQANHAAYEYPEQAEHIGGLRLDRLSYENPATKDRVSMLWSAIQLQPTNAAPRFELARILLRHQYTKPAITLLNKPCCKEAQSPLYHLLLSNALISDAPANLPRSTALLEAGARAFPGNAQMHTALGHSYNSAESPADALIEFEKALRLPAPVEVVLSAHLGKAAAYRKLGNQAASQKELTEAKRIYTGISKQLDEIGASSQLRPLEPSEYFGDDGMHPLPSYRAGQVRQEIDRIKKEQQ
jgi:tetratricopeptide (TPR) repeat protein